MGDINTKVIPMLTDELIQKTLQHQALNEKPASSLQFDDILQLFKLKSELAQLHLAIAYLIEDTDKKSAGRHLKSAFEYNPFVTPKLMKEEDALPKITQYHNIQSFIYNNIVLPLELPIVLLGVLAYCAAGPFYMLGLFPYVIMSHTVKRPLQAAYVYAHCLSDIPSTESDFDCLCQGIYYFYKNDNFLALRYFLEAAVRSKTYEPEALYFVNLCLKNLYANIKDSADLATQITLINNRIDDIKEKVLKDRMPPRHSLFSRIWKIDYFGLEIKLHNPGKNFFVETILGKNSHNKTILSCVRCFKYKFERQYPHLIPVNFSEKFFTQERVDVPDTFSQFSVAEMLALLSQVFNITDDYIDPVVNHRQSDPTAPAILHLKRYKEERGRMPKASYQINDHFTEMLGIFISDKNYPALAHVIRTSAAKYWVMMYEKLEKESDSLSLNYNNLCIYIHHYLLEHFEISDPRFAFFTQLMKNLISLGCDSKRLHQTLSGKSNFSTYLPYAKKEKEFYYLIETLDILSTKPIIIKKMTIAYAKYIHEKSDFLSTQIKSTELPVEIDEDGEEALLLQNEVNSKSICLKRF